MIWDGAGSMEEGFSSCPGASPALDAKEVLTQTAAALERRGRAGMLPRRDWRRLQRIGHGARVVG